jgi:23S rRNA pseudouridine2605 synthase
MTRPSPHPNLGPNRARAPTEAPAGERLQKRIAAAGLASRRAAEKLIREGRVRVNGAVVSALGTRVGPRDRVQVDGERVPEPGQRRYYLLHKPRGVVSTARDAHARRTVVELVPAGERVFPVGRLDAGSEGLVLLTNDGALAHRMLHPSFEVERRYRVSVDGLVEPDTLRRLVQGIELDGRHIAPLGVRLLRREEGRSVLEIRLAEGRRRQLRRMLEAVGHPVRRLVRVQFGPLELRGLRPGEWRVLGPREARALERALRAGQRAGASSAK